MRAATYVLWGFAVPAAGMLHTLGMLLDQCPFCTQVHAIPAFITRGGPAQNVAVQEWLKSFGLGSCASLFHKQDLHTMQVRLQIF